jgi:tetratricopeptide (TPR) repeat protein
VQPKSDRDLDALNTDFRRKAAADDAIGYEMMLRRDPLNVAYQNDAALLYLELGQAARAAAHFRTVAELQPQSATAFFNLGTALLGAGRFDDAVWTLRRAIAIDPDHVQALNNIGNALVAQGAFDEAIDQYRRALALDPRMSVLHNNLGRALALSGKSGDAQAHFRRAAALDPRYAEPHYNIGRAAAAARRLPEAVAEFRQAIELAPDFVAALVDLAELLSSSFDDRVIDPDLAVRLAERASALTDRKDPRVLDVLGAAYAAHGRFDRALAMVAAALALDPDSSDAPARRQRVELYKTMRPFRLPR